MQPQRLLRICPFLVANSIDCETIGWGTRRVDGKKYGKKDLDLDIFCARNQQTNNSSLFFSQHSLFRFVARIGELEMQEMKKGVDRRLWSFGESR